MAKEPMTYLGIALEVAAFLGTGIYLLTHQHPTAGGFCIFVAACVSYTVGSKDDAVEEEKRD
jgi:hypothetical protein